MPPVNYTEHDDRWCKRNWPEHDDRWCKRDWPDQLQQVYLLTAVDDRVHDFIIERVVGEKSRRKRWVIVDRSFTHGDLYPRKVAGPFPNLDAAKVAYLILRATT